jgi:hypothetical protein
VVVVVVLAASSPPHNTQTTGDINQPTTIKSKTQQQLQVKRYHKGRNKITTRQTGRQQSCPNQSLIEHWTGLFNYNVKFAKGVLVSGGGWTLGGGRVYSRKNEVGMY